MMDSFVARIRIPSLATLVLSTCGWATSAPAEEGAWWRKFSAYGIAGIANVNARPDTGGNITLSFDDSTAPGVASHSMAGGSGRDSDNYMPHGTLGLRFNQTDNLSWGIERYQVSFNDHVSTTPRSTTDTGTNFATDNETSSVRIKATDLVATARYARWGVTLDGLYGKRDGSFAADAGMGSFGVFTTGNFVNISLSNGSSFSGDGKVKGLGLSYQIPRLPVSVFTRYKRSELDGKSDSFARVVGTVASSPSAPLVGAATVTRNNAEAHADIRDYEYGVQYDFKRSADEKTQSFVRLSYLKTEWKIDGLPTGGAGFGGTIGELTTNSFSRAGLGGVELKGYSIAVGVGF